MTCVVIDINLDKLLIHLYLLELIVKLNQQFDVLM